MRTLRRGYVVLNDVAQVDRGQRIFVLDAALDVDQPFAVGVVALRGIGQKVL